MVEDVVVVSDDKADNVISVVDDTLKKDEFGPFSHQINKGGLDKIVEAGQLKSFAARQSFGGMEAVRATPGFGSFGEKPVIEFYTRVKPDYLPSGDVRWCMPEDDLLDIHNITIYLTY